MPTNYQIGRFEIDTRARQLRVDGQDASLGARAFDLLVTLVERRDRTVPKEELLDLVWPGLVVEENNLQVQISTLRKVLGAKAIATIPGRGYQFTLSPADPLGAAARPVETSAVKTLLLTDAVDSTRLAERIGDEAVTELWRVHDRIARDLLQAWRGQEIGKTDGMLLLFDEVGDAVGYSLAFHRALAARNVPMRMRAAIHCGPLTLRRNDAADIARGAPPFELAGLAVAVTSRLMSIAQGGQTLLSDAAHRALAPVTHALRSHGFWQFQGVSEPTEVFEIADGAASSFRPPVASAKAYQVTQRGDLWQPTHDLSHSLPAERDGFVGRRDALQTLGASLESGARLVSILGTGGCGKTRLATRFAWERLGDYPGGAWFCDLSQARTLDGIAFAVAQGLQVALNEGDPMLQLAQVIAGRGRCLVILDNFEQVVQHAEATLGHWVDRAPLAHFVATTREVLGIAGESALPLSPLSNEDATELFARRAASARLGYVSDSDDAEAIRQLVRILDGLPLAIELAAARVRVLPPRVLVARVRDRFDLIGARGRRHDRQATLRATFDWSWDLLEAHEKASLATLSVFEGGFDLDAASSLLAPALEPSLDVIDAVQGLVDKSLLRQVDDDRFDMLETVREYAGRQLVTEHGFPGSGPDYAAAARARHWCHFATLDERSARANRCIEAKNLVAACRAATHAGDAAAAAACLTVAWFALRLTGPYRVAVELAENVARLPNLEDADRGSMHWVAADALEQIGEIEPARRHLQLGLELARRTSALKVEARLLMSLGNRQTLDGDLSSAQANLAESHRLAVEVGDANLQMRALNAVGLLNDHQSRWTEAKRFYEEALVLARTLNDRRMEGGLLGNLGGLYHDMGDLTAAEAHYGMAMSLASELGDQRWEGNARSNLGLLYQEQDKPAEARHQFETALALARTAGYIRLEYTVLCNLGILLASEGRLAEAGEHFQKAVDAAIACADRRGEGQFRGYLALNQARRGLLDEARATLAIGERLLLAMSDRLSYALLLCDRAEVEVQAGYAAAARQALGEARELAVILECRSDSVLCRRIALLDTLIAGTS